MTDAIAETNPLIIEKISGGHLAGIRAWLYSHFEAAAKDVPDFEYTPQSVAHLHNLATVSQAKTQAAGILANDFHQKAVEYRCQASRIREILENVGLAKENFPPSLIASSQVLANVANLLNIKDTELSSFLIAMGDISLRKTDVEEKSIQLKEDSKVLLNYTRKAIKRLSFFRRIVAELEEDLAPCEAQMEKWKANLEIMVLKEQEYMQRLTNYKTLLSRLSYTPEISHGVLIELADHRIELQKKTKPIIETLRSYLDLPPDRALALLALEERTRQYAKSEKRLEDVLQSALYDTTD